MSGITLQGFATYLPTLFDGVHFPQDTFNASLFKNALIRRWGMQCPWIQNPHILAEQIGFWCDEQQSNFATLYQVFNNDYNPLHNYDRLEDLKEIPNITTQDSGTDKHTLSGTDVTKYSGVDTDTQSERAYNSGALQAVGQAQLSRGTQDDIIYGKSDSLTHGKKTVESGTRVHENHIRGNIGVTTTAQMIESEMALRSGLNPYDYLSDMFANEFLTMIA